jgi:hypothetical protein
MSAAKPRVFRYPWRSLASDYAQSGIGLVLTAAPMALTRPAPVVVWILGAAALLFLVYFGRTVCRQLTRIELDEAGIRAVGPMGGAIRWDALRELRLDYYTTRRDGEEGWMQLRLRGGRQVLRIDSALSGFPDVVLHAAAVAARRDLVLDASTAANLEAFRPG